MAFPTPDDAAAWMATSGRWQLEDERGAISAVASLLGRCRFFKGIGDVDALLRIIAAQPKTVWVEKQPEEAFYQEGMPAPAMYFLVDGLAAVRNESTFVTLRHAGQQMALTLIMSGEVAESSARALTKCRAVAIEKDTMTMAFGHAPRLIENAFKCHVERNRIFQRRLDILSQRDRFTAHRITRAFFAQLDNAIRKHEEFWGTHSPLDLKLERQQVAALLGVSESHFRKNLLGPLLLNKKRWDDEDNEAESSDDEKESPDVEPAIEWSSSGSIKINSTFRRWYADSYPALGFGEF